MRPPPQGPSDRIPIRRQYCKQLRDRVIHQKFNLNKKTADITIDLDMSLRVVQRTIKLWHDVGDVVNTPAKLSRAPLMTRVQEEASVYLLHLL
jgi:hypothetical protein